MKDKNIWIAVVIVIIITVLFGIFNKYIAKLIGKLRNKGYDKSGRIDIVLDEQNIAKPVYANENLNIYTSMNLSTPYEYFTIGEKIGILTPDDGNGNISRGIIIDNKTYYIMKGNKLYY